MGKWTVEMCYGLNVTVEGIEAETREDAEKKARKMVDDDTSKYVDVSELEFEQTTFATEEK